MRVLCFDFILDVHIRSSLSHRRTHTLLPYSCATLSRTTTLPSLSVSRSTTPPRKQGKPQISTHIRAPMHVTACLAGQKVDVEVGEDCRSLQALREAIVKQLPQLCVEGFDVSVGGRALDSDEGVVSLQESVCLDVVANSRGLGVLALREAGREVSEEGLRDAAAEGDASLCALYLDAGVPIDCVDADGDTPLLIACGNGYVEVATLLLDRGSTAIDKKGESGYTPLLFSCCRGHLEVATLLLDRGSTAIDEPNRNGETPLHLACTREYLSLATLLLDRGSSAIDAKNCHGDAPLHLSCGNGCYSVATLLLDRGSRAIDEKNGDGKTPLFLSCGRGHLEVATLLLDRGSTAINERDHLTHNTPLHISCRRGYLSVVTLLLDRGCSVARTTNVSYPEEVSQLLLERGHVVLREA